MWATPSKGDKMLENDLSSYLTRTICLPFKLFREECTKQSDRLAVFLSKAIDKWSCCCSVVWFDVLLLSWYWISGMQYSSSEWPVYWITKKWSIILPKAEERIVRWVGSIEQIKGIQSEFVVLNSSGGQGSCQFIWKWYQVYLDKPGHSCEDF